MMVNLLGWWLTCGLAGVLACRLAALLASVLAALVDNLNLEYKTFALNPVHAKVTAKKLESKITQAKHPNSFEPSFALEENNGR